MSANSAHLFSPKPHDLVLAINAGSSSIKFAVHAAGNPPRRTLVGTVERIGLGEATLRIARQDQPAERLPFAAGDPAQAAASLIEWLDGSGELGRVTAVGHRLVHGGRKRVDPQVITEAVLADLREAVPLDPAHLPLEIRLIEALAARRPEMPQFACFDAAFHKELPPVAARLPIPRHYADAGIRRYGFHGLSYAFLMEELERVAGTGAARGRSFWPTSAPGPAWRPSKTAGALTPPWASRRPAG
ncbi:hypothetical protein [Zavarzinella formosa]|uniref:hypothetical protein n=1 Tax=Zavarzinella formosa TaxID=360055 RepID=UPI0021BC181A|nr:hypothetical protein [Zavarzinella formosa]